MNLNRRHFLQSMPVMLGAASVPGIVSAQKPEGVRAPVKCGGWNVGVCTWSFQRPVKEIGDLLKAMNVDGVHLALEPALKDDGEKYLQEVCAQNWRISSTMLSFPWEDYSTLDTIRVTGGIAPDEHWAKAKDMFIKSAKMTKKFGCKFISLHAGFLDHTDKAYAKKFHDRMRTLADIAAENSLTLLLETGQETAEELQSFLESLNHKALALNFDPANMILYNKDKPVDALKRLSPWIRHVHAKDAVRTAKPGTWGAEVPWGDGDVNVFAFLSELKNCGFKGDIAIEREAGNNRAGDIALAARRLAVF